MKFLLVLALAALVAVPAASGYRNPTAGRVLVLQIPGMHRAKVRRGVVYKTVGGTRLRMDVYRPRRGRGRLPAVLLGGPSGAGRRTGQKMGWAQLIAASGMAAVAFDIRSDGGLASPDQPTADVQAAIAYVRAHGRALGIDPSRLCTLGFSLGTAPWHLAATMRDPKPYVRCNVVFYGALDLTAFGADAQEEEQYSPLAALRRLGPRIPPMLLVEAGQDATPGLNDSIAAFAAAARKSHADVRLVTHATAPHAFDVAARSARSRNVVREALHYLRSRLRPPLRFRDGCGTPAERSSVLRFFASDDTRLLGITLGSGDRGVVLAHENRASLCNWLPYARDLAALGYRVLAYDTRNTASSGSSTSGRIDLDMVAGVDALRRLGAERVVVGGASLGAAAAIAAGAELAEPAAGVLSLSAPTLAGPIDAEAAARTLRVPLLLVAAAGDTSFAAAARQIYSQGTSSDRTLSIVPGGAHGTQMLADPSVHALVTAFVKRVLG